MTCGVGQPINKECLPFLEWIIKLYKEYGQALQASFI